MALSPTPAITVLGFGRVTTDNTEQLVRRVGALEQIDLRLERDATVASHVAEINRAIDAASCDWVLLVREHETIGEGLAAEIAESIGTSPRAWGCRVRTRPLYRGKPLNLDAAGDGELRLLHRRHARFLPGGEPKVQGTVIRAREPFVAPTFASEEEHVRWMAGQGTRRNGVARIIVFAIHALRCGVLRVGTNGLRYLWIDAAWRRSGDRQS
ncbi:MAG: hypothetical protein ACSLFQ_03810 [Thermoanaerobaculia bacterium]